jgi:acyl phosphate:glycerol-3-phosphate acyltransferase
LNDFSLTWPLVATGLLAYLLGSIPFGLIVTRLAGLGDVRKIGSGNIGATNVLRTGRKDLAALTLLLDAAKGAAAVLLAACYGGEADLLVAGLAVIIGHMYPIWLKFRGGKAIAAGLGVVLAISWPAALAGLATWIAVVALTRYSSLGSLIASAMIAIYVWFFTENLNYVVMMAAMALLVIFKHRGNIVRLLRGEEPKIGRS